MSENQDKINEQDSSLKGIGGWLLFLCLSLTILGPLLIAYGVFDIWHDLSPLFSRFPFLKTKSIIYTVILSGIGLFGFYTGLSLWMKRKNAIKIGKIFLVTYLIANISESIFSFVSVMVVVGPSPYSLPKALIFLLGGITWSVFSVAIWYSYLNNSRRVKATYGEIHT